MLLLLAVAGGCGGAVARDEPDAARGDAPASAASDASTPDSSVVDASWFDFDSTTPTPDAANRVDANAPDASAPDAAADAAPPASDASDAQPGDSGACSPPPGNPCNLVPNCGCAAAQKCDVNPSNTSNDVCVAITDGGAQGAPCAKYPDCSPGYACVCTASDAFGCSAEQCQAWCVLGGANTCTAGTSCTALGQTIKIGGLSYGTCQ